MKGYQVAVVGATGLVGSELLGILEQRDFPVKKLIPFASQKSKGTPCPFRHETYPCRVLSADCFQGVDFAFFDVSEEISRVWVPQAQQAGAWVIDHSSCFRMDEKYPLIVPEVNGSLLEDYLQKVKQGCVV